MIFNTKIINIITELSKEGFAWKEMFAETPFFQADMALKKSNLIFELTEEEEKEYIKCSQDIIYFANKYVYLSIENGGTNQLSLRNYQIDYLNLINKPTKNSGQTFVVNLCARQMGITLVHTIQILHDSIFKTDKNTLICSNTRESSEELIQKIKSVYVNLPFFLKPGVRSWNQASIIFDNGCKIKTASRSKNAGIGFTIQYIYILDAAFIPENIFKPFYTAMYPITAAIKNTKFIISSTPNGMNLFHTIYTEALAGKNGFKANRLDYWLVPGRNEEWKEKTIKEIGGLKEFEQEYLLQFTLPTEEYKETKKDLITIKDWDAIMFRLSNLEEEVKRLNAIMYKPNGDKIINNPGNVTWNDVQDYLHKGGTYSNPLS